MLLAVLVAVAGGLFAYYGLNMGTGAAVVDGHPLANDAALLTQALAVVDKAYGGSIGLLQTASDDSYDTAPAGCYFLRDANGTFGHMVTCGGALLGHGCAQGCGGEVDFILAVPFRVERGRGGWVGALDGRPVTLERSQVVSGDRLWRPDGEVGTITNHGKGMLETEFGQAQPLAPLAGGAGVLVAFGALAVGVMLVVTPRPHRAPTGQSASAKQAWDALARSAFAPPVTPPSPVLVVRPPAPPEPALPPAPAPGKPAGPDEPAPLTPPPPTEPAGDAVHNARVNVLGPVEVTGWAEEPTRAKTTELAAYLALHTERPVAAERLRTVMWPYDPAKGDVALATVHQEVSRLRRCLGAGNFAEAKGGYQFAGSVSSDWGEFQALVEASRAVDEAKSTGYLRQALSLVRGEPFAEVAPRAYGWAFDEVLAASMEAAVAATAHAMAERSLATGRRADAAWAVRQGLRGAPRDELVRGDQLTVAAATEGRAGLGRAWEDLQRVLGTQPEGSPLAVVFRRLWSGLGP
jgi:DNA-binding SARP family transcriptional activator